MVLFIKLYLISLPVFFALDMFWLGVVAKNFYREQIGALMKTDVNWPAAMIFYLLFIAGLVIFSLLPAIDKDSLKHAVVYGSLFGFLAYATYDLTNLATLKGWPLTVTLVDMVWGTVLAGSVCTVAYLIADKLGL